MAMIAGSTLANRAGQYLVATSVNAIAEQIRREIGNNLTMANIGRVVGQLLPGKANKQKRNAVTRKLIANGGNTSSRGLRNAPVAINFRNFRPKAGTNNFRVRNREFVTEVTTTGSGAYNLELAMAVQPAISSSFPWLAQVAVNHQRYKFHSLKFTYVPSCGTNTAGRVAMAYAIDPLDTLPEDQQTLYQYPDQTDSALWSEMTFTVPANHLKQLFTREMLVPGSDLKTYDNGVLFLATYGAESTLNVGSLFVEYDVELINPQPRAVVDSRNIHLVPVSNERWTSEPSIDITNQAYRIIPAEDSTGLQFTQTGWFCVRVRFICTTTDSVIASIPSSVSANAEFGATGGGDVVIQEGVLVYHEMWIKIIRLNPGNLRHVAYDLGAISGLTNIFISVNKMKDGQVTTI